MKKFNSSILTLAILINFNGCGSESNDSNGNPSNPQYQFSSGSTVKFTLNNDENIIIGKGCTYADVYDSDNNKIGSTNAWESNSIPSPLSSGNYTAYFSELFGKHVGSKGILYFKTSGFSIGTLTLNSTVNVPDRTANIYKLTLTETSSFIINTESSVIEVYDSNLNNLGSTSPWASVTLSDPLTLSAGEYYFTSTPYTCKHGGLFNVTKI